MKKEDYSSTLPCRKLLWCAPVLVLVLINAYEFPWTTAFLSVAAFPVIFKWEQVRKLIPMNLLAYLYMVRLTGRFLPGKYAGNFPDSGFNKPTRNKRNYRILRENGISFIEGRQIKNVIPKKIGQLLPLLQKSNARGSVKVFVGYVASWYEKALNAKCARVVTDELLRVFRVIGEMYPDITLIELETQYFNLVEFKDGFAELALRLEPEIVEAFSAVTPELIRAKEALHGAWRTKKIEMTTHEEYSEGIEVSEDEYREPNHMQVLLLMIQDN